MPQIKRLILDVLKPHNPNMIELSSRLSALKGVSGVNCILEEVDQETESIKIIIEGPSIDFEAVKKTIEQCNAVIHSVDGVAAGKKLVRDDVELVKVR